MSAIDVSPAALRQLAAKVEGEVFQLADGRKRWTMSVPVRDDDSDILLCRAADTLKAVADACEADARTVAALRADYEGACQLVARMHAVVVGEGQGSKRGPVEDIEDALAERDARIQALTAENTRLVAARREVEDLMRAFERSTDDAVMTPEEEAKAEQVRHVMLETVERYKLAERAQAAEQQLEEAQERTRELDQALEKNYEGEIAVNDAYRIEIDKLAQVEQQLAAARHALAHYRAGHCGRTGFICANCERADAALATPTPTPSVPEESH